VATPAGSSVQVFESEYTDAEQLGDVYNGPDLYYKRSEAGTFHSQMKMAVLGELSFHANHHASPLLVEGVNRSGDVGIGFVGPNSMPRRVVGELFTNSDLYVAGPGVEHVANVMPGQQTFLLLIPAEVLATEIAARLNRDPVEFEGRRFFLRIGRRGVSQLIDIIFDSFRAAQDLIALPSSLETLTCLEALEQLQKTVVERVVSVLMAQQSDLFRERPSFSSTGWVLLQVREYFEQNERSPVRLADVCRAVGVSQRTLQVAFAEGLGVSPMRYLKLRRLHAVRTRLQRTSSDEVTVTVAAREAGFVDLSRFSRDYRELFGHLPSETERRR
jgi:AraC family ethanolamine operon transcriptional activator